LTVPAAVDALATEDGPARRCMEVDHDHVSLLAAARGHASATSSARIASEMARVSRSAPRMVSEAVKVPGWPDRPLAIKAGGMVYVGGMQGRIMSDLTLVEGGVKEQTDQALTNLQTVLAFAGSSMEDVAQCSVSLADITDFAAMNEVYETFFPKDPPARVAIQAAALANEASVVFQCDAALVDSGREVVKVPGLLDLGAPFSLATKVDGMIFLSGSLGMDLANGTIVPGGVAAETKQALANLLPILEAAGSSADRVVACSVFLSSMDDFAVMNEAYSAFWTEQGVVGGLPSRVCVEVGALVGTGKVEIQCTAAGSETPADKAPKVITVPGAPDAAVPFSAATTAGGIAYVSGTLGSNMTTGALVTGGIVPQTTQALLNIQQALEAAGTGLEEVVACEVSLTNMSDFSELNKAYGPFWPEDPPSRVVVQVGALAAGSAAVEIRCRAALP